jgi:chemotaxis protein methyltransferase CheR
MNRPELQRFRDSVERRLGLHFGEDKFDFLADVLRERGRDPGYVERLDSIPGEWRALAEKLTVGETYFFRYADHFRAFSDVVLTGGEGLRLLSAGCASGEEPFSMAILVRRAGTRASILGIDVNPATIARARQGRYSLWSLREVPTEIQAAHFRSEGREVFLDPEIRGMVEFEERNLIDEDSAFWRPESFDAIFCRNVLMYFSTAAARAVVARFARALRPGGHLFLGHAETLRGLSDDFHLRHTHDSFYYRRKSGAPAEPPIFRAAVAAAPVIDGSWVDAIQQASHRIAALSQGAANAVPPTPVSDLGSILDLMRQERFADALERLRRLPPDPDVLLLTAVILTNAGRLGEAERACERLLAVDELNAGAHYLRALCREHAGDRGAAVDHDQTAAYLDPEFAMPRLHLGLMARRAGDEAAARREFEAALPLLEREDGARILLFGGGFDRAALVGIARGGA